jgi:hypothetical protein
MSKIRSAPFSFCILFLFMAMCYSPIATSQSLPPFEMALSTGKVFKASRDLTKGSPVIVIYFDPDCDHCQKLMKELFRKISSLRKAEIVMITFKTLSETAAFEKKYNTHKYPNITVGTEGNYFYLRNYYKLVKMPFTALYDSSQNFVYSYREETSVDDLITRLKKLK